MKGNQELVDALNGLLASELTSINQYMVHAEMAEDWGYTRLSENFKKRSITEMKHAERLIERILFLEGTPIVSHLNDMHIGAEIPQQVNNDHALELDAIRQYNEAIVLAGQVLDYATRDILEAILRDEDTHLDELEELQDHVHYYYRHRRSAAFCQMAAQTIDELKSAGRFRRTAGRACAGLRAGKRQAERAGTDLSGVRNAAGGHRHGPRRPAGAGG